jgi:quercetin dioxygenase-like cupin family protein
MTTMTIRTGISLAALIALVGVCAAQQPTLKRTELQRGDLSVQGREAVTVIAELPAKVESGRHTHPGEEIGYMLEGSMTLEIEGKPAASYKAGDAFIIPSGAVHNARNTAAGTTRVLATYVIPKGLPLATPAK